MAAVAFGALAGVLFGALAVSVRLGLRRGVEPEAGAAVAATIGFLLTAALASATWTVPRVGELWPFVLIGAGVPGASQILFVSAIRDAGPSRAAILIGSAPVMSIVIALAILDEPFRAPLVAGTLLIVAGGAVLTRERVRPHGYVARGALLALACAALFAVRDNLVRWVSKGEHPPPLLAAAASMLGAAAFLLVYRAAGRRSPFGGTLRAALLPFAPAGIALGLAYACLLEGLARGRVSVVAPLNATQSLWAVAFAAILIGRSEAIGPRLVAAGVLVVSGSALIGVFR